jgi:hypothetical protein
VNPVPTANPNPIGRYRRQLAEADLSLEANTETTPEPGHFYVIQAGRVLVDTEDFPAAEEAYKTLCREHWDDHLASPTRSVRIASAWGLLYHDPQHPGASAVIQRDGTEVDAKRLQMIRMRRRVATRTTGHWR